MAREVGEIVFMLNIFIFFFFKNFYFCACVYDENDSKKRKLFVIKYCFIKLLHSYLLVYLINPKKLKKNPQEFNSFWVIAFFMLFHFKKKYE